MEPSRRGLASLVLALAASAGCAAGGDADAGDFDPRAHEYAPLPTAGPRGAIRGGLLVPPGSAALASSDVEVTAFPLVDGVHDFGRPFAGRVEGARYVVGDLTAGNYGLRAVARASGASRWVGEVEVRAGRARLLDLELAPTRPVHVRIDGAQPGDSLTWRVRSEDGTWFPHHALTGAPPEAAPPEASFRLVPGDYLFEVDRGERRRAYEAVHVAQGERVQEIALRRR